MNERIRTILQTTGGLTSDVAFLSDTDDLASAGLKSLATVRIMLALEEAFSIEFPSIMLSRNTFANISSIQKAVGDLTQSNV